MMAAPARASRATEDGMRKLSIGVAWTGDNTEQVIRDAKVADEAGVDSLFVAETWGHDAFTLLTLLARETKRIKLGTAIVNIYSRSPGALAQHFATLDQLSGGRMLIGLGTSGPNVIEHFHGVKFEKPFTRTREYVEIINMLLRQEKLDYDGDVFKLARGFTLRFTPVRPHIPIWIASITPKSVQANRRDRRRLVADLLAQGALERAARAVCRRGARSRTQAGGRARALSVLGHRHR